MPGSTFRITLSIFKPLCSHLARKSLFLSHIKLLTEILVPTKYVLSRKKRLSILPQRNTGLLAQLNSHNKEILAIFRIYVTFSFYDPIVVISEGDLHHKKMRLVFLDMILRGLTSIVSPSKKDAQEKTLFNIVMCTILIYISFIAF